MKIKASAAVLIALILLICPFNCAFANSAQTYWQGTAASGAIIAEKDCPITVEHELLTFDINDFPPNYYRADDFSYTGKVTAEYTFRNPADYTVTATLAFPFGTYPSYIPQSYNEDDEQEYSDTHRYGVTVNGIGIESNLRHTYINGAYSNADLEKIGSSYIEGSFYKADMPVTKYTFKASGITKEPHNSAYASFSLTANPAETRTIMLPNSGYDYHDGKKSATAGVWVENGDEIVIYAIGKPYESAPAFTVYYSGAEEEITDGSVELTSTETMTYEQLVFTEYEEERGISKVDWFNAIVCMHESIGAEAGLIFDFHAPLNLSRDSLMRWYIYEITLAPGQTLTNAVTVPIYPDIDGNYEPSVYSYEYLLSPAATWKSFGALDIIINTPYYIIDSGFENTEKTENGYKLSFDSLPDGELEFKLSASQAPEEIKSAYFLPIEMIISFSVIAAVVAVIAVTAVLITRKKRKKQ